MNFKRAWRAKRELLIISLLFGVCLGLFYSKNGNSFSLFWLSLVLPLSFLALKRKYISVPAILLIGILFGLWRGNAFYRQVAQYNQLFGKSVVVTGPISDDPGYDDKKQTEFHVSPVTVNGKKLPGRVRVRGFGASDVARGDTIKASGKLNKTIGTGRQGSVSFANISVTHKNTSWVEKARSRFFASVFSSLPEPQASLALGYLVGVRTALPKDFALALSVVGLTHIVAVSGYNLTIIVQFVKRFFEKRSAYQTVLFSTLLIAGFLLMTGWSPSIMRASVISMFSLLAWYYGRTFNPIVLILLGASITGFISPFYIWGDVGWYLSFLAFSGVLILAPLITQTFYKNKQPGLVPSVLIETLSAQALALPFIAVIFGQVSIISPIANILVIPFIPFAMLMTFIIGVVGVFSPIIALWLALPLRALMTLTVWIVEKLAALKWAQASVKFLPWQAAVLYAIILVIIIFMWLRLKRRKLVNQEEPIDWNLL